MPRGRPKKMVENKCVIHIEPAEQATQESTNHFDTIFNCFRCGWGSEHGAKLEIIGAEKLCQKCRE